MIFYGVVTLVGITIMVGVVFWLRSKNLPTDIVPLQAGNSVQTNQNSGRQQIKGPAVRPFKPLSEQPSAESYVPGSSAVPTPLLIDRIRIRNSSTTNL